MNKLPNPAVRLSFSEQQILKTIDNIRLATERPSETKTQIADILHSIEYFLGIAKSEFKLAYNANVCADFSNPMMERNDD